MDCLDGIFRKRPGKRRRASSYDREGGNIDYIYVEAGEAAQIARIEGCGIIRHFWMTTECFEEDFLRKLVLEIAWDNEENPSVNVPLGDFFGMGHGQSRDFVSAPLQMSCKDGRGLNCWWPMPFSSSARFTIRNQCEGERAMLFWYIDYEELPALPEDALRLHAQFRRQNPCDGMEEQGLTNEEYNFFGGQNTDGAGNYVILEAQGSGQYVGCHLDIHNLRESGEFDWYGEGDDMIFIDGDIWPPTLHGTGTEDYFCTAFAPGQGDEYCAPYHGLLLGGEGNFKGKSSWYRYHIADPVMFDRDIRVTIEHGHANRRNDDYSSTAYWYQQEPHRPFGIPPCGHRLPRRP